MKVMQNVGNKILKINITFAFLGFLLSGYAIAASPQTQTIEKTTYIKVTLQERLVDQIFAPTFFLKDSKGTPKQPLVEIIYTGDDYGWPVYAIGIYQGCLGESENKSRQFCRTQYTAYKLSAKIDAQTGRIRNAGRKLTQKVLSEIQNQSRYDLISAFEKSDYTWEKASLNHCVGAMDTFNAFSAYPMIDPSKENDAWFLHADKVSIKVDQHTQKLEIDTVAGHGIGKWATDLYDSLDYCWTTATTPKPWETLKSQE